jgi:hypothetical protein
MDTTAEAAATVRERPFPNWLLAVVCFAVFLTRWTRRSGHPARADREWVNVPLTSSLRRGSTAILGMSMALMGRTPTHALAHLPPGPFIFLVGSCVGVGLGPRTC